MRVKGLCYHRNGVTGAGFHVAIVKDEGREMLVVRFPKELDGKVGNVLCAAFDLALLDKRIVRFGENSFRGDVYASVMDEAISNAEVVEASIQEGKREV